MKERKKMPIQESGRYLPKRTGHRKNTPIRMRQGVIVLVLLSWDGLLLYMIVRCLIEPVYGGLFIAIVSVYMGYQLKQED